MSFIKWIVILVSLALVGFGQPSWSPWCALVASLCGYALFWSVTIFVESARKRFWISALWFTSVQLIQLSWLTSHPFLYIYGIYFFFAALMGAQFGLLGILLTKKRLQSPFALLAFAGFWTLMEWLRLFILVGFTWNPAGLALTSHLYPMQMASLLGIYGLSFWVILVNLLALRAWLFPPKTAGIVLWLAAAILPYLYGYAHINFHKPALAQAQKQSENRYHALLVQTAFPSEEALVFTSHSQRIAYVLAEWRQILQLIKEEWGKKTDLIALPEFVVPYGTYTSVFPHAVVASTFSDIFGPDIIKHLPPLKEPLAEQKGNIWLVNNAYWLQSIANLFHADVVSGLEDAEYSPSGELEYYSAAIYVPPNPEHQSPFFAGRYEKRVLMPMGEYIPFHFMRQFAAAYGISSSFTPGKEAKIFGTRHPFGLCICYEETFGHIMRENSQKGAHLLVNLTNDGWYPLSKLPQQHFDLARLRTVENGMPLLRACNTGVTSAVDCLGRVVAKLDNDRERAGTLHIEVPIYTYRTLYRYVGDTLIVAISLLSLTFFLRKEET